MKEMASLFGQVGAGSIPVIPTSSTMRATFPGSLSVFGLRSMSGTFCGTSILFLLVSVGLIQTAFLHCRINSKLWAFAFLNDFSTVADGAISLKLLELMYVGQFW